MKKYYGLALLLCLPLLGAPLLSHGQARNTGVRLKGPLYQDAVLLITKNLLQVRAEIPFYGIAYATDKYKGYQTPILLGIRYERLVNSKIGAGIEFESNSWDAKPESGTFDKNATPEDQTTLKFTPFLRYYIRKERKAIFRGITLQLGPTIMNIQQSRNESQAANHVYTYEPTTLFGIAAGAGVQHTFGNVVVVGLSAEAIFCGEKFVQEGFYSADIGNGAVYFNPFKFYIGGRF